MKAIQGLLSFATVAFLSWSLPSFGQEFKPDIPTSGPSQNDIKPSDVVHWQVLGGILDKSGLLTISLRLIADNGWTLYQDKVKFTFPEFLALESSTLPDAPKILDPISGRETAAYAAGEFEFKLRNLASEIPSSIAMSVTYVGCTVKICLFPFTQALNVPIFADKGAVVSKVLAENKENRPADTIKAPSADGQDVESKWASELKTGDFSLGMIALVFFGGILTNLTPCVFPMIPITIRLLSSQGSSAFLSSCMYALGILLTYTGLGIGAALSGALFGGLLASTAFNIVFALLMFMLGFTMLGFGDLSFMQQLGSRIGAGKPSPRNSLLMGCGAGLVAAPCTGPILAALLAYTAGKQDIAKGSFMLFVYSLGFAIPYVFLGGAAAKMTKFKLSPFWQLSVKYLFAGVMFGLSFYYLRIPAYRFLMEMKPYWMLATIGVLPLAMALVALWVLLPGLQMNKSSSLIPSILLGLGLFSGSQWLAGGNQDSGPITNSPSDGSSSAAPTINLLHTEDEAFAKARETGRPILIDAWAEWCEACKKMDKTTFAEKAVITTINDKWVMLKLDLTESSDENDALIQKYGIPSLPSLVMLPPSADLAKKKLILGYTAHDVLLQELSQFRWE